jgi:nitric oxide reductase subunit B
LQLFASLESGYWYARSAEFMQRPIVDLLVWPRVPGDTIFAIGAALAAFVIGLWVFPRHEGEAIEVEGEPGRRSDTVSASEGRAR